MASSILGNHPQRQLDTEALRATVATAVQAAQDQQRAQTVRLHLSLGRLDPWQLLGHPQLKGRKVFAWCDDAEDRTFLALEVLHYLRLSGEQRFSAATVRDGELRATVHDVGEHGPDDVDPHAPFVCAGFAFGVRGPSSTSDGPPWSNWDDGTLWVPHALVHRLGERSVLVVSERVDGTESVDGVIHELRRNAERLLAAMDSPHPARPATPALGGPTAGRTTADRDQWTERVRAAQQHMMEGGLDKVVLARAECWTAPSGTRFDPFATAAALRARQSRCTTFVFCRRDGTAFVGATPETLVRRQGRRVSTVALAGTVRRDPEVADEELASRLLDSPKDRHEQQLVTHAIQHALGPVCSELEIDEVPRTVRLADVLHLETRISGQLARERSVFDLLGRLHPTPAVGGLPAKAALHWLETHEGLDRGYYAAPVGWVDASGDGHFAVAIRSVLLDGDEAWTFAGCGLVPDSDPAAEWRETLSKLQAVSHGLAVVPEER